MMGAAVATVIGQVLTAAALRMVSPTHKDGRHTFR